VRVAGDEKRGSWVTRTFGRITDALGSPAAFIVALWLVLLWGGGLFFVKGGYQNNTYQLLINTGTTIVTFLMVFIVQETQNRDNRAIQTKLDAQTRVLAELARATPGVDPDSLDRLLGLEEGTSKEIKAEQRRVRGEGGDAPEPHRPARAPLEIAQETLYDRDRDA
jgi:low affinity Fe/Cu permease